MRAQRWEEPLQWAGGWGVHLVTAPAAAPAGSWQREEGALVYDVAGMAWSGHHTTACGHICVAAVGGHGRRWGGTEPALTSPDFCLILLVGHTFSEAWPERPASLAMAVEGGSVPWPGLCLGE